MTLEIAVKPGIEIAGVCAHTMETDVTFTGQIVAAAKLMNLLIKECNRPVTVVKLGNCYFEDSMRSERAPEDWLEIQVARPRHDLSFSAWPTIYGLWIEGDEASHDAAHVMSELKRWLSAYYMVWCTSNHELNLRKAPLFHDEYLNNTVDAVLDEFAAHYFGEM